MADIIQIRRDTASNWASANPTLAQGELGIETDTSKMKVGDGSTAWNSLGYLVEPTSGLVASQIVASSGKTTPVDADLLGLVDSAASNVLKKLSWANIKATLKAYFDTLYVPLSRTITINGNTQNLSANRTWTIATGGGLDVVDYAAAWYTHGTTSLTGHTMAKNTRFYVPLDMMLYAKNDMDISKVAFRLSGSGAGGTTMRVGIYERTTLNNLTLAYDFGTVGTDSLNTVEFTFTAQTLTKGKLYYLVYQRDDTSGTVDPQFQSWANSFCNHYFMVAPSSANMWQTSQALYKTGITIGSLASTDTLPTVSSNTGTPRIQWYLS